MSNSKLPVLFIKEGCPYCAAAMEYLDDKGIQYEQREVRSNPDNMQQLQKVSGQNKTPTMVYDEDVLANFGVEQLDPFLQKHQLG